MFTYATLAAVAVASIPVSAQIRIWVNGHRERAEIRARISHHRRTCCGADLPKDTQGAAPIRQDNGRAPQPRPLQGAEVTTS